jgi:hypothetical protein
MTRKFLTLIVLSGAAAWGQACDRRCLETFVDLYMEALIAHNPAKVPLSPRVRNTEDGVRLEPGDGFWRSARGKGTYRLFVTDTETGQVGFLGTMREDPANPVIIALRLKVQNRQITEIENIVVRDANLAARLENRGRPDPLYIEAIPAAQRASRADLIRVGNAYLSGLERNDGKGNYPVAADCVRVHNGVQTSNNPNALAEFNPPPAPGRGAAKGKAPAPSPPPQAMLDLLNKGCLDQLRSGYWNYILRVRDRRFTAVDRERGLVFAIVTFDEPSGKYRTFKMADGREVTAGPARPESQVAFLAFRLEGGLIRREEAVQLTVPYGMIPGWSSYEDGMSSRAQDIR